MKTKSGVKTKQVTTGTKTGLDEIVKREKLLKAYPKVFKDAVKEVKRVVKVKREKPTNEELGKKYKKMDDADKQQYLKSKREKSKERTCVSNYLGCNCLIEEKPQEWSVRYEEMFHNWIKQDLKFSDVGSGTLRVFIDQLLEEARQEGRHEVIKKLIKHGVRCFTCKRGTRCTLLKKLSL